MNNLLYFIIIAKFEIKLQLAKATDAISNLLFFIIFLAIFHLTCPHHKDFINDLEQRIAIINIAILAIFANNNQLFLKNEFDKGIIAQIFLNTQSNIIVILAKMLINWLKIIIPLMIILALYFIVFFIDVRNFNNFEQNSMIFNQTNLDFLIIIKILAIISISSLAINSIFAISGAISIIGNNLAISLIIAFPMLIPIIIIGQTAIFNDFLANIQILLAIAFLSIVISNIAIAKIIEIAE
jgi:ABC-type transport system involved in cytochrome c biogenesis permease component